MILMVEISLYPLQEPYIPFIQAFIDRLNEHKEIKVSTTTTCTLISGEYECVFSMLQHEMRRSYEEVGQAIFVCKFLNGDNVEHV